MPDYADLKDLQPPLHRSLRTGQGRHDEYGYLVHLHFTDREDQNAGYYTDCTNRGIVKYPHADGAWEPGPPWLPSPPWQSRQTRPTKDQAWGAYCLGAATQGAQILATTGTILAIMTDDIANMVSATEGFLPDENSKRRPADRKSVPGDARKSAQPERD